MATECFLVGKVSFCTMDSGVMDCQNNK